MVKQALAGYQWKDSRVERDPIGSIGRLTHAAPVRTDSLEPETLR